MKEKKYCKNCKKEIKIENYQCYAVYKRNLFDKDVAKFLSKMLLIAAFRDDNCSNDEIFEEDDN